ncbi:MAG: beta-ketoacyl-[acyl-carrier-protein] synthase family protein [Pirellulales bacterium]|nr:beta-ketoacyl-[acyl-carrier-protein] synthase family protein [Pirellulales bacterium]
MNGTERQSNGRRVVITGLGVISPLGCQPDDLWRSLVAGRSGVGPMTSRSAEALPTRFAAETSDFSGAIEDFGDLDKEQKKGLRKGLKMMCRECQMGVAAAQKALASAGIAPGACDPTRMGVTFGTDYMLSTPEEFTEAVRETMNESGEFIFARWARDGMPRMSPLWLLKYLPNMPASHVAIYNDLRGPNNSITLREAAPNLAVTEAFQIIAAGRADVMLVGATGTRLHAMKTIHAAQQEELAATDGDPAAASRPFDRDRRGAVLGEGAGAIVLETLASAQARGATVHGEIVAGASSVSVHPGGAARRERALRNSLTVALDRAGMTPEQLGHVHAHGLSTRSSDAEEAAAIQSVFGRRAAPIPVVTAKGHFGNLGAAGGMVELVASLMALRNDRLFPVLNFTNADPECPVRVVADDHTPPGDSFINLNVTPQGQAAAVLIRRTG